MLELRCPAHPGFTGDHIPGHHGLEQRGHHRPAAALNQGAQSCGDCWELYRQKQERAGNPEARR